MDILSYSRITERMQALARRRVRVKVSQMRAPNYINFFFVFSSRHLPK